MNFTDRRIADLSEEGLHQDAREPMLLCRVGKRRKVYVCNFYAGGRQHQTTLGHTVDFSVEQAREECRKRRRDYDRGGDDVQRMTLGDAVALKLRVLSKDPGRSSPESAAGRPRHAGPNDRSAEGRTEGLGKHAGDRSLKR
jgi:hypothetical protein